MATLNAESESLKPFCEWYFLSFRTAKDIQVLEYDEIHPKRTAFVAALGEGAFGKVHLATYKHGLEYFKDNQESSGQIRQQFVAVKELHGKPFLMFLLLLLPSSFFQLLCVFVFVFFSFYFIPKTIDNKATFNFAKVTSRKYFLLNQIPNQLLMDSVLKINCHEFSVKKEWFWPVQKSPAVFSSSRIRILNMSSDYYDYRSKIIL